MRLSTEESRGDIPLSPWILLYLKIRTTIDSEPINIILTLEIWVENLSFAVKRILSNTEAH